MRRVALTLLATMFALAAPATAQAAPTCAAVTDAAHVLIGSAPADLTTELAKFDGQAHARVLIVESVPGGDLDAYAQRAERNCGRWDDPQRLLIALDIKDRHTGVYYGSALTGQLDGVWQDVQNQQMNPLFREGDYAGGLMAGVDMLAADVVPVDGPGDGGNPPVNDAAPTSPMTNDGSSNAFGAIAALIAVTAVVIGLIGMVMGRQTARRSRQGLSVGGAMNAMPMHQNHLPPPPPPTSFGGGGGGGGGSTSW